MSPILAFALALYALNLLVGVAAQLRLGHFGIWHHILYFLVFASAVAALVFTREWWVLLTVACLAAFPRARPGTPIHPALGVVGLVGYLLALGT